MLSLAPLATSVSAETPDGRGGRRMKHERIMASLSPEERTKLRAAHKAAMADPAVQAAKDRRRQSARELRDLRRAKMLQADPSIQPILDKMQAARRATS